MLKQVSVAVEGNNPFRDMSKKYGCKLDVVDCKDFNSNGMGLLFEVSGARSDDLLKEMKAAPGVKRVYSSDEGSKKVLTMVILETPLYCNVAQEAGAFCMSCPYASDVGGGKHSNAFIWDLMLKDSSGLGKMLDRLQIEGAKTDVKSIANAFRDDMLTFRQREILITAIQLGHFEFPRKIGLTELAEKLSIKPSTLSEILRRAEAKIAQYYLDSIKANGAEC